MNKSLNTAKKLNTFWFWWNIVEALVILAGGVLAIFAGVKNSASGNIETILAYAISSFIVLDGLLRIIMFFPKYSKGDELTPLVIAGFEVSIGVLLMILEIKHSMVIEALVNLIAVLLIVMGALILAFSIFQIVRRLTSLVMPIGQIILGAVLIGVGVAVIILHNTSDTQRQLVLIMTGTILVLVALTQFIVTLITHHHRKKDIAAAENAEIGNYEIEDAKPSRKGKKKSIPSSEEIVDVEEEEKMSLNGPKAIEHKDE